MTPEADEPLKTRDGKRTLRLRYFYGEVSEIAQVGRYGTVMAAACMHCGEDCWRDEADVGVGIIYGPWGCECGWSESAQYNQIPGPTATGGYYTNQYGHLYPTIPAAPGARDSDVPS